MKSGRVSTIYPVETVLSMEMTFFISFGKEVHGE